MDIARAIAQINPLSTYLLTNSNATSWEDILEWYGPGEKPTPEQLEAAWQDVVTQEAKDKIAGEKVVAAAKSAEGKDVNALTAAERNALVGLLLIHAGAVDQSGKVRPVQEWAGSNPLWAADE